MKLFTTTIVASTALANNSLFNQEYKNDLFTADFFTSDLGTAGTITGNTETCWLDSYGRTAGKPLSTCRPGEEKDGLLCYPECRDGYYGVGPVCWSYCPSDFRDDGAFCAKPGSYGRGAGKMNKNNCGSDCEKNAGLWYPKCRDGFYAFGCCVCSP